MVCLENEPRSFCHFWNATQVLPTPCYGVQCLVAQSCLTLCDPMDCNPSGSSVLGESPGKNTGVGCHALLQGIFTTQGSRIIGRFFSIWAMGEAQEYWNGYPIPFPGYLPNPGIELGSPALQTALYQLSYQGIQFHYIYMSYFLYVFVCRLALRLLLYLGCFK